MPKALHFIMRTPEVKLRNPKLAPLVAILHLRVIVQAATEDDLRAASNRDAPEAVTIGECEARGSESCSDAAAADGDAVHERAVED